MSERDRYIWAYWNWHQRRVGEHPEFREWDLHDSVREALRKKIQWDSTPDDADMWPAQIQGDGAAISPWECAHSTLQLVGHSEVIAGVRLTWDHCARCGAIVNQTRAKRHAD